MSDGSRPADNIKSSRQGKAYADHECSSIIGSYFKYGKIGHKIEKCLHRSESQPTIKAKQNKDKNPKIQIQGRVYAFTQQDVQTSISVVTGSEIGSWN